MFLKISFSIYVFFIFVIFYKINSHTYVYEITKAMNKSETNNQFSKMSNKISFLAHRAKYFM